MINIKLTNKVAYTLIAAFILIAASVAVYAATYSNPIPDPGHGGNNVWISSTDNSEKTLQQAIDSGDFGGGVSGDCEKLQEISESKISSKNVSIPDYCKNGRICHIMGKLSCSNGVTRTRHSAYVQDSNGKWNYALSNKRAGDHDDATNGNSRKTPILGWGPGGGYLYDDMPPAEVTKDSWMLRDESDKCGLKIYSCPY